ncbi:ABC transporter ATP-binding protein YxdL [Stieleria maiorica]|uniref:ABC transporter ATP-binding protein YxdL n=1 Tax=Stieleria maiorica TaxID=2795974 RepID=A0A5B9MKL4_9BACT|nr:ATP-binding cassette domain-containing protein [Stieleria maiorica]QEG00205.1 ABC transporter ATP-binding protein YxdL [Stieleria maiorica]
MTGDAITTEPPAPQWELAAPILEFHDVNFKGTGETSIQMKRFTGALRSGELVEVELERHHNPRDLVSMMLGLNPPDAGEVLYDRQDWLGTDYPRHFQMRSEIGRVFAGSAWVQSLTLRDNIQLPMRHHGIAETAAKKKVAHWIRRLTGHQRAKVKWALKKRPNVVEPSVLQLCQLVRAVANGPRLLILERPLRFLPESLYDRFVSAMDDLRDAGTAILFFAGDRDEYQLKFRKPVNHWRIVDGAIDTHGRRRP